MSGGKLGDGPIEARYRAEMNAVARTLDEFFNGEERPPKVGFVLLVFEFGSAERRCNYISNAKREDIIQMLREQLRRFEGH